VDPSSKMFALSLVTVVGSSKSSKKFLGVFKDPLEVLGKGLVSLSGKGLVSSSGKGLVSSSDPPEVLTRGLNLSLDMVVGRLG